MNVSETVVMIARVALIKGRSNHRRLSNDFIVFFVTTVLFLTSRVYAVHRCSVKVRASF